MTYLRKSGAPTKNTVGNLGDIYVNTDNGEQFELVDMMIVDVYGDKDDYTEYVWQRIKNRSIEPSDDDIPKVFFGEPLPQTKSEVIMKFRYISKTMDIDGYCKTKAQGDTSMTYPKKNQTVKLYKDAECTKKLKVNFKQWGAQSKFVLKANWIDISHARNIVSAKLWGDVVKTRSNYSTIPSELRTSPNQGAIDGFFVKVYAGGVYQGRYTLNIPKDAWMANMDDSLDEHCILCGENYLSGCFRAAANINGSDWTDEIHDTVPVSIKTRWNEVISFVINSTDEDFVNGIDSYIDLESLIDYYCVGLLICHNDGFGKNQLFMTYDGIKWYASYYDLDNTFGTYLGYMLPYNFSRYQYEDFNANYQAREGNLLYIRIEKLFAERIKSRYAELRKDVLSVESTIDRFERFLDVCPPHLVEEDYAATTADGQFTEIPLKAENNIQQIRDYIVKRYTYVDGYIDSLQTDSRILYSLYDATFDGTADKVITTDVKLFDTAKSFTVFLEATTAAEQPKNTCLIDCARDANKTYCGGFQIKTTYDYMSAGFMVMGAKSNGGANLFNVAASEERTKIAVTYRNGLPELMKYRTKSDATIYSRKPFTQYIEETIHDGTISIGGTSSGGELYIGTIHTLEIYDGALSTEEIDAWLSQMNTQDETLVYRMSSPTEFNGTDTVVDTGVKLFDTAKDFTIAIDFTDDIDLSTRHRLLGCRHDVKDADGMYIGGFSMVSALSNHWYNVVSRPSDKDGGQHWFNGELGRIYATDRVKLILVFTNGVASYLSYKLANSDEVVTVDAFTGISYEQHDKTLLVGADRAYDSDTIVDYWKGTVHALEVYDRAFSVEEAVTWINETSEGLLYRMAEPTVFNGVDTVVDTGVKLFDTPKDFTIVLNMDGTDEQVGAESYMLSTGIYSDFAIRNVTKYWKMLTQGCNNRCEDDVNGNWLHSWARTKSIVIVFENGVFTLGRYKTETDSTIRYIQPDINNTYIKINSTLKLGALATSTYYENFWKGTINDFRVYNRALSEEEVNALILSY